MRFFTFLFLFTLLETPFTQAAEILSIKSSSAIIAIDYSPDGKRIVSGGQTNDLTIWDISTAKSVLELKGHTDNVVAVKYSPNGRYIASGGVDNKIIIWDAITGDILYKHASHRDYVRNVAFSPDNKWVASASWDGTAIVWNVLSGDIVATITGHIDNVTSVAFSPDGSELLTASGDKTIRAWDTKTWSQKYVLLGHTDEVWNAKYAPNDNFIVSGGWDNKVRVWDVNKKKEIYTFLNHTSDVWSVAFSPDNQTIVSGGGDRKVLVFDMATGEFVSDVAGNAFSAEVECVTFSPDGKFIAAASRDGYLRIFDAPGIQTRKRAYVGQKTEKWNTKGDFEKSVDFQKRLASKPQFEEKLGKEFEKKVFDYYTDNVNWKSIELEDYDADKELYHIKSPVLKNLIIRIPPKEAENLKVNFNKVTFKTPYLKINNSNNSIEMSHVEINVPREKDTKAYLITSDN